MLIEYYKGFYNNLLEGTLNKKNINFLDASLLIANSKKYLYHRNDINYDNLIRNFMLEFFPKEINTLKHKGVFFETASILVGINLLFEPKQIEKFEVFHRIKVECYKDILRIIAKKQNQDLIEYDVMYGISGFLNYSIRYLHEKNDKEIQRKIVDKLLYVLFIENNTFSRILPSKDNEKQIFYLGVAHGIMGILYSLNEFSKRDTYKKKEINEKIEQCLLFMREKFQWNTYFYQKILYLDSEEEKSESGYFSWCHGISGYTSFLIELYPNKAEEIVTEYIRLLEKEEVRINLSLTTPIICHGIASILIELFCLKDKVNFSLDSCIKRMVNLFFLSSKNDSIKFYDELNPFYSEYNFLNGGLGCWLVLQSLLNDDKFEGAFLICK